MSLPVDTHSTWRGSVVLPVLLLAGILALPAPAGAARPDRCKASGSETLLVTRDARVYKTRTTQPSGAWTEIVSGCVRRTGKRFELSRLRFDGVYRRGSSAAHVRDVGHRLAFVFERVDDERAQERLGVRASSIRIVGQRSGSLLRSYRLSEQTVVTDFEAQPGAVAWIEIGVGAPKVSLYTAHSETQLDWGMEVDPESLTMRNGSVYWRGGNSRSVSFRTVRGPEARCRPPGSIPLIATKDVRVFRITRVTRRQAREETLVYHCVRRTGKRVELGRLIRRHYSVEGTDVRFLRRVGKQFAYVLTPRLADSLETPFPGPSPRILDLRTGRVVQFIQLPDNQDVHGFETRPEPWPGSRAPSTTGHGNTACTS